MVNIEGLNKAHVLASLYNNARPLGSGFLQFDPTPMSLDEAEQLLNNNHGKYFEYLNGRVMKVDLSSDIEFNEVPYDRDNGLGAAQRAINTIIEMELQN